MFIQERIEIAKAIASGMAGHQIPEDVEARIRDVNEWLLIGDASWIIADRICNHAEKMAAKLAQEQEAERKAYAEEARASARCERPAPFGDNSIRCKHPPHDDDVDCEDETGGHQW